MLLCILPSRDDLILLDGVKRFLKGEFGEPTALLQSRPKGKNIGQLICNCEAVEERARRDNVAFHRQYSLQQSNPQGVSAWPA